MAEEVLLVDSRFGDDVQWLELASSEAESVDLVFFSFPQLPSELLNQSSEGSASNQHCLGGTCTHPLPASERHGFVQVHWIIALIKKPLWLPFLRAFPLFLVHVAGENVHSNLKRNHHQTLPYKITLWGFSVLAWLGLPHSLQE